MGPDEVRAGCGTHGRDGLGDGGRGHDTDALPPGQVEETESDGDSEDERVFGPPTPPQMIAQLGLDPDRPQEPWEELMTVVGHLWDEGSEHTVFMVVHHLREAARECAHELVIPLRDALRMLAPYDDGVTRTRLPQWWAGWLDNVLGRWVARRQYLLSRSASSHDEVALVQTTPGNPRPILWRDLFRQVQDYPKAIQGIVSRRLRKWVRDHLDQRGPELVVLGGLLLDIEKADSLHLASAAEERELGVQLGESMVAMLEGALANGSLASIATTEGTGLATRDAARDLAARANRTERDQQLPIDDSWGNSLEHEELQVGIALSRWIRRRLPRTHPQRTHLFNLIIHGLREQLAQECRHLRRLHMGLEHAYTMGINNETQVDDGTSEEEMQRMARDYVDQIVLNIGHNSSNRSVLSMLQEGGSSSSSTGPPPRGSQGSLFQEGEALRRWLNGVFEGSLSTLLDDHVEDLEWPISGQTEEAHDDATTERTDAEAGESTDEAALVQPPFWERDSKEGARRRPRSRSPSTRRTENDGNDHRPWRREAAGTGREDPATSRRTSAGPSRAVEERRTNHSDALATALGPQAWHCLLEMRSPMDPVEAWGYGLPATSSANVEASYGAMTNRERQVMNLELLRVLSAILADIAQAMTTAMSYDNEDTADSIRDRREDEGDDPVCRPEKLGS